MSAYQAQQGGAALPTSETTRVAAGRIEEQENERVDFHGTDVAAQALRVIEGERKRLATLQARAALAGIVLHKLEGDDGNPIYVATKWHLTRELRTLDDVAAWLDQVTGGAA